MLNTFIDERTALKCTTRDPTYWDARELLLATRPACFIWLYDGEFPYQQQPVCHHGNNTQTHTPSLNINNEIEAEQSAKAKLGVSKTESVLVGCEMRSDNGNVLCKVFVRSLLAAWWWVWGMRVTEHTVDFENETLPSRDTVECRSWSVLSRMRFEVGWRERWALAGDSSCRCTHVRTGRLRWAQPKGSSASSTPRMQSLGHGEGSSTTDRPRIPAAACGWAARTCCNQKREGADIYCPFFNNHFNSYHTSDRDLHI